ncbi:MAG TPA: hypothetical protein VGH44_00705 [Candidatus Saccharimonadia bacterium]|jgi:hypothetical protein
MGPAFNLWIDQRRREMDIDTWAKAVHLAVAALYKVRRLDDDIETTDPVLAPRIEAIDISPICLVHQEVSDLRHLPDRMLIRWPGAINDGVCGLLGPNGSARYAYAEIHGRRQLWTYSKAQGRVVAVIPEPPPRLYRPPHP